MVSDRARLQRAPIYWPKAMERETEGRETVGERETWTDYMKQ